MYFQRKFRLRSISPYGVGFGLIVSWAVSQRMGFDTVIGIITWSPFGGFQRHYFR